MSVLKRSHIRSKSERRSADICSKSQHPGVLQAASLALGLLFLLSQQAFAQLSGYSFRKQITIDNAQVSGTSDLTDFPLLISVTDTDLRTTGNGGDVTDANGYDIIFTSSDGVTRLDHELEKYDATTGEFVAWVRIPTLEFDNDTEIYIYYGNSTVTTDQSVNTTWSGDYQGVWHLDESSTGGTDDFKDATSNANHITGWQGVATQTPAQTASGKIGYAQDFDGGDGLQATSYQGISGTSSRTLSGWFLSNAGSGNQYLAGWGDQTGTGGDKFSMISLTGQGYNVEVQVNSGGQSGSTTGLVDGSWHYIVATLEDDGSPSVDEIKIYIDGADDAASTGDTQAINTVLDNLFSIGINLNTGARWVGSIDEVRLSNTAKSADWIATEYANQSDPSSFYSVGAEEDPPAPAGLSEDLVLWLRADAGTNTTIDAGAITSWLDKSGQGHDATGTGDAVYQSSFSNFNPGISFTDDDRAISGTVSRTTGVASTIIVVGNISTVADKGLVEIGDGTNRGFFLDQRYAGTTSYALQTNTPTVWRVDDPGGMTDAIIYENAQTIDTQVKTFNTDWTSGNFYLGDDRSGGNRLTGSIAEVIVYDRLLTTAEKLRVEGYVALKYGITLSTADGGLAGTYRASNLFNIWNGDPPYHNDVAGIGRDDASDLEQQKSISINSDAIVLMDKGGSFDSDLAFIVWGNDNGAVSLTTTDAHPDYDSRLEREWLADVWGSPGAVSVKIIYPANTGLMENYVLHVDADGVFASGATNYPATSISGDTVIFDNVTFSDDSYFTMGQIIQGPGGVNTDLTLWLKADNRVKNSAVEISSGSVDEWENSISNANFAEVTLADGDPLLTVNEINYNPTIYFDGVDDRLSNEDFDADILFSNQDNTSFVAFIPKNRDASTDVYMGWQSNGSGDRLLYFERAGSNALRTDQFTTNIGGSTVVVDDVSIGSAFSDATGRALYVNGELDGTDPAGSFTASGNLGDLSIGTGINGSNDAESYIGEVVHYESALTASERQQVESYLAIKYGVTLSTDNDGNTTALEAPNGDGINEGDYVNSQGTVLWDASGNSTYHNNVAGIGRDDFSGLSQIKSMSVEPDAKVIMDKGSSFSNNQDFILWGHDAASHSFAATDNHPDYDTRLERVWKVATNGSPGQVTVRVLFSGNTGVAINYALHVDTDGTFATGSINYVASDVSGDTITFEDIPFADGDFFTVGQVGNGPGGVQGNLTLWLRGDVGTSTTTDGLGLTTWQDQSGSGNTVSEATNPPTFRDNLTNNINFNPVADFDRIDASNGDLLIDADGIFGTGTYNDLNVYVVSTTDIFSPVGYLLHEPTTTIHMATIVPWSDGDFLFDAGATGNNRLKQAWGGSTGTPYLWGALSSTTTGQTVSGIRQIVERNGASIGSDNDMNSFTGNNSQFTIGSNGGTQEFFDGQLAEVVIYTGAVTAEEHQKIQSYLAIKYGMTLGNDNDADATTFETPNEDGVHEGDYVASDGTVLWDADVNSTYHNDIAGIGWDIPSALDQRRSMSVNSDAMVVIEKNSEFATNLDFIVWGNDDGATTLTTTDKHPDYQNRLEREWKVAVNGSPGPVDVKIIYAANTGVISNYALHVDDDGTFASGTTDYEPNSISGDTLIFEDIEFNNGDYFTLGEIVQSPGGIGTNIRLWLRADAGVTGTSFVTAWADQSGNEHHTSRWSGDPQLLSESINFNPAMDLDGNDYFATSATDIMDQATGEKYSVFAILESDNVSAAKAFVGNNSTFARGLKWYINTSGQLAASHFFNFNAYQGGSSLVVGKPSVATVSYEYTGAANPAKTRLDGTEYTQSVNMVVNHGTGERTYIGNDQYYDAFDGRIAEVIMYEEKLSDSDIDRIESYLAIKAGVTLDSTGGGTNGDYILSDGTTVLWDADVNADYHSDVAGIGKDLTSGLDQHKSISANSDAMVIMEHAQEFAASGDFIIWGNNNDDATTITAVDAHPNYLGRIAREWLVSVHGSPDTVTVQMIFANNNGIFGDYVLHVDADGTFASGATNYPATALSGDTLTFPNVILNDGDYFTIGETPRSPGGISSNLTLWTKANDGARYSGFPITSGPLDQWDNAEDNLSLTSVTLAAGTPTVVSNQINYNPAIYFDGVDDMLAFENIDGDVLFSDQDNTIFTVVIPKNRAGDTDVYLGWESDAGSASGRMAYFQRSGTGLRTDMGIANTSNGSIDVMDQAIIATAHSDVSAISLSVNGDMVTTDPPSSFTAAANQGDLRIGAGPGGSFDAESYLAEFVIYENALTPADIQKVESYFAVKYGITLGNDSDGDGNTYEAPNEDGIHEGDYVSSGGVTIWDADANTAYNNDIIAIARDDEQALYQRQSRTTDDSLRIFVGDLETDNANNVGFIAPESGFIVIGHNAGRLQAANLEMPTGITSRFGREWKVTNTDFSNEFGLSIEWDSAGTFDINDIRLLVDDDGDFSNATVLSSADGLTFSVGSIVVEGISTTHIPTNSTRYLTIGSVSTSTSLPIDLIGFEATALQEEQAVRLEWATASESNNDFFTVERSRDTEDWIEALVISGAGDSDLRIDYEALDTDPFPGLSYYRLKQTDFDGGSTYSQTVFVLLDNEGQEMIIYPNPAGDLLFIKGRPEDLRQIQIFNSLGQDMSKLVRFVERDQNTLKLNISALTVGTYTLRSGEKSLKLIKSP